MSSKLQQPHLPWEVDHKLGHKSPPVQATSNLSTTLYRLIKARAKQCPTTLHKEDQGMTLLENGKQCLISRDKMKVMITCNHIQCRHLTRRSDDKDTWDGLASEVKNVSGILGQSTEENAGLPVKPRSTHKCVEKEVSETSHSQDGRSQTHHTRNDESGLNPQRDSRPMREGCEQDGPLCRPSNEPNDRPERLSPQHSQRDLDKETPVDVVTRSR